MDAEPLRLAGMPPESEPNPPRDYLVKGKASVSLHDGKLRYSYDHKKWDPIGKKLYREHYVDVFDGSLFKFLQEPASGQQDYPRGTVKNAKRSESALQYPILPLILTFRGSHSQFFGELGKFQVTGQVSTLAGRPCLELIRRSEHADVREFLYLDSERHYVPIRQMIVVEGQPDWQMDVAYSPDQNVGWVPRSWEYIIRAGKEHRPMNAGFTTVTAYKINPPIANDEFDIRFPPNTRVIDESSGQETQYVIRGNGEKGREMRGNPTYEDLQRAGPRSNPWLTVGLALTFALALSLWIWWRLRKLKRHP